MVPKVVNLICFVMIALIFGIPTLAVVILFRMSPGQWQLLAAVFAPLLYMLIFVITAGVLSLPFQGSIIRGKFPRDLRHPVYRGRRFYGTCWTTLYYCKPIYFVCLTVPLLKWVTFRLFGYRGQMNFTIYPDTWIRDLPLLDFGKGAYLANRVTLGTNMPLNNGRILVDSIRIGNNALIGHLAVLATGTEVSDNAEVESGCVLGLRSHVGRNAVVTGTAILNHYAVVGDRAVVGAGAFVGFKAKVPNDWKVPPFVSFLTRERSATGADTANE